MLLGSCLGAQFKAIVEYAPSQRVPKPCSREDSREGNIFKGNLFIMKKNLGYFWVEVLWLLPIHLSC